jgi:7-cyano-7-deazaguanine synthase
MQYPRVEAICFDYGQKHRIEIESATRACAELDVPLRVVEVAALRGLVTSALTGVGEVGLPHAYKPGLPSSFVPARNALFLTLAHAYAQELGAGTLVTGVCETDYSGYPDCRHNFVQALALALNIGYETDIDIRTPLMWLDKASTFELANRLGPQALDLVVNVSHTCYNGDHSTEHEWGFGCGQCPACVLRAEGYSKFREGNFNADLVTQAIEG